MGTIGRVAGKVGSAIDPITGSLKAAKTAAKGIGHVGASFAGVATGAGGDVLRQAARSGFEGGEASRAFRENMRGAVPMEDVVADATAALNEIKRLRSAFYREGMKRVSSDRSILDFSALERELAKTRTDFTFKGISKNPKASAAIQKVAIILDDWKKLDPKEFHTPEGFDALKQRIGSVLEDIPYEQRTARKVVGRIYNAVKSQIAKQAPAYAKTMRGYEKAAKLIREIETTLSLNPRARIDTQLRKLQSVMRNNVNTTYGRRVDLVKLLEASGAKHLLAKLAGQAANSWAPRSLARVAAAGLGASGIGAALATLNPATLLPLIPMLALQSPRLMGEAVHAGGIGARYANRVPLSRFLQGGFAVRGANEPAATR
jgi:hypothetical protein